MTKNLWNVPPNLAINDVADSTPTDAVLCRQSLMGNAAASVFKANSGYLLSGQLTRAYVFAKRLTAFGYLVGNVIGIRAKKQMSGIYTAWVVAFVAHNRAAWYGAIVNFPRHTRRTRIFALVSCLSVPSLVFVTCPFPTFIGGALDEFCPEEFLDGQARPMISIKGKMLTFDPSVLAGVLGCYPGGLAATALAISIWDFIRGVGRGMIRHVNSLLLTLTTPRDDSTHRRGNFMRSTRVIIAQGGA